MTSTTETRGGVINLDGFACARRGRLGTVDGVAAVDSGWLAEDLAGRGTGLLFIGVPRYEQLSYRAVGQIPSTTGVRIAVSATGLRTHRYGPRSIVAMRGHSWLTALFPSGRAFGSMRFPGEGGTDLFR